MKDRQDNGVKLNGVIAPIVTPLDAAGGLDEEGIDNLVEFLIEGGIDGIFVGGTTGEFASLPLETRQKSLEEFTSAAAGRLTVYYGVSHSSTRVALEETKRISGGDDRVDALVATTPFYYVYSQEEIKNHYRAIAGAASLPVFIYNIPSLTRNEVELETLIELSEVENIVGVKDTTGDMARFQRITGHFSDRDDFTVAQGTEELLALSLEAGADGLVTGVANLCPAQCKELYRAVKGGNLVRGLEIQRDLLEIFSIYEPNSFLAGMKTGLKLRGVCQDYLSPPFERSSQKAEEKIERILEEKGVL